MQAISSQPITVCRITLRGRMLSSEEPGKDSENTTSDSTT